MNFLRSIMIVAVLLLQWLPAHADDVITNIMSPIVSYQYLEDLQSGSLTNGDILSHIVSYQYFEWPGDDVLQLKSSPEVSYLYNEAVVGPNVVLHGRVLDVLSKPVADATVTVSVMNNLVASILTKPNGTYVFGEFPSGLYVFRASKTSFIADERIVKLGPMISWQEFHLKPMIPPIKVEDSTEAPKETLFPNVPIPRGSQLKHFDGEKFVVDSALQRDRMTIVITHGWSSTLSSPIPLDKDWIGEMASRLYNKESLGSKANILAWDWSEQARAFLPPEEKTLAEGSALGKTLYDTLGANYAQPIHFIGNSLGALVNAVAADFLHGHKRGNEQVANSPWNPMLTHVTLTDEAEIAHMISKEVLIYGATGPVGGALMPASLISGWKWPLPANAAWIDNYVSMAGFRHQQAVNIYLQKGLLLNLGNPIAAHAYAREWYARSIILPQNSLLGFRHSFDAQKLFPGLETTFPPSPMLISPGSVYRQVPSADDDLALELVTPNRLMEYLDDVLETAAYYVEDYVTDAARKTGNAIIDMAETTAINMDNGLNYMANALRRNSHQVLDLVNHAGLIIMLRTEGPIIKAVQKASWDSYDTAKKVPTCVWLPVVVPVDASVMAFDFTISGDGKEDYLAFGINGTNLFALQTKFVPENKVSTSSLIDVTPYAGITNELFFGLTGNTSTNCLVTVEKIRFYTLAAPILSITNNNGIILLSWSSTANDYFLESTPNLSTSSWSAVTNPPALMYNRLTITNTWTDHARYFRLRK